MKQLLSAFLLLGLVACAHHQKVIVCPAGEKTQVQSENVIDTNLLSQDTEHALGQGIETEVLKKYKPLNVSTDFQTYANEIVQNVGKYSNRPELTYEVSILDTKETFAIGLPGGKIFIGKGLLKFVSNESEFANLIGDEIAHIAKQHLIQNLLKNSDYAKSLHAGNVTPIIVQESVFYLLETGFDIDKVNEADRLAPAYVMHVGYDTNGLWNLLQRMQQSMQKNRTYGKTDQNFDLMNHRASMNGVFVKQLEKIDRSKFPKAPQDRFQDMLKKIKPVPVAKKK